MEHSGRLSAVFLQRRKERSVVPLCYASQNIRVELRVIFLPVENPTEDMGGRTGNLFSCGVRNEIKIKLRSQIANCFAEPDSAFSGRSGPRSSTVNSVHVSLQYV